METEILKLVSTGGSVVVLFGSIIIFLRELNKRDAVIKDLQIESNKIFSEMRLSHNAQVAGLITQLSDQQKYYQEQFRAVMDEHIETSKDVTTGLKLLENEIRNNRPR